jgi:hypothetical protein
LESGRNRCFVFVDVCFILYICVLLIILEAEEEQYSPDEQSIFADPDYGE